MGRMYTAPIDIASGSANVDLIEIIAGSAKPIAIHEILITTDIETDTNELQIKLQINRVPTPTPGSGGASITVEALSPADTAFGGTAEQGNTTKLTGTADVLSEPWMNNRVGFEKVYTPEGRPIVAGSGAFVVTLQAAPTSTAFAGHVIFEELV